MEAVIDVGRDVSIARTLRSVFLAGLLGERSQALRRWASETGRRLRGRPHVVLAFLQLDDPYSYLLSQFLPSLAERFDIELRLYLSEARRDAYQPEPELLAEYALIDCARVARELGIPFLDKGQIPPVEHRLALLDAVAAGQGTESFNDDLLNALEVFWRGDAEGAARRLAGTDSTGLATDVIANAQERQTRLGHFNGAMLHYGGEWYWGVDRLHYLVERLDELGATKPGAPHQRLASISQAMAVNLPVTPPEAARALPPIELFCSVRSPYSYLAIGRLSEIAGAFGLALKLRPVLPMVMRGLDVPRPKLLYIVRDAAREAARRDVAFGRIADPAGIGVERCLAVFHYAESKGRGREFLGKAGEAIWAKGVDVATDAGLRKVAETCGIAWPEVQAAIADDAWREAMEANREALMTSGCWGVPTIRCGDFVAWGQDRDWLLVRHLEERCDSGDGILK